jgi:UDP-N-acetylmuramate-alanine ligase
LIKAIKKNSNVEAFHLKSINLMTQYLDNKKKNLIIFMGAGDISNKAINFVNNYMNKN